LPNNFQLVGGVFVEAAPPALSAQTEDLTPSMDREGYLENDAYRQLVDVVRAGIEYLALEDKQDSLERQEIKAKEAAKRARTDFRAAIQWIKESRTLTRGDKARLIGHYTGLVNKLEEVEEYDREARKKLETMGLLGVVAGFMTHEAARILDGLERAIDKIQGLARRDKALTAVLKQVREGYAAFKSHVDYTSTFVDALHQERETSFKSSAQVKRIIERFGDFAADRNIQVVNEVSNSVQTPKVSVAMYSGILLNLYSNALKAILAAQHRAEPPHIVFRGWNEPKRHIVEVLDKGIGIPAELHKRVFDPLFTTTSNLNNPLGSGMGLGLSLIRELVRHVGGSIRIVKAPRGFSTCFRVEFPKD
jgi:signal transduction histidine kinase